MFVNYVKSVDVFFCIIVAANETKKRDNCSGNYGKTKRPAYNVGTDVFTAIVKPPRDTPPRRTIIIVHLVFETDRARLPSNISAKRKRRDASG